MLFLFLDMIDHSDIDWFTAIRQQAQWQSTVKWRLPRIKSLKVWKFKDVKKSVTVAGNQTWLGNPQTNAGGCWENHGRGHFQQTMLKIPDRYHCLSRFLMISELICWTCDDYLSRWSILFSEGGSDTLLWGSFSASMESKLQNSHHWTCLGRQVMFMLRIRRACAKDRGKLWGPL